LKSGILRKLGNPLSIILGIFIGSRLLLIFLIGNCNALAPDEFSYLAIFIHTDNPSYATPGLEWVELPRAIRILIFLPAMIFHELGVSYLIAFRLQSVILGCLQILAGYFLIQTYLPSGSLSKVNSQLVTKKAWIYALLIILLPSTVIWTSLGLREPILYLSVVLVFLGYSKLAVETKRYSFVWSGVFLGALTALAIAKQYLFVVLSAAIIISLAYNKIFSRSTQLKILLLTICAILLQGPTISQILTLDIRGGSTSKTELVELDFYKRVSVSSVDLQKCKDENRGGLLITLLNKILSENLQPSMTSNEIAAAETSNEIAAAETSNEIAATDFRESDQRNVINLGSIPSGLFAFIFFPLDFTVLSIVSLVGIIETLLWIPIYLFFIREYFLMRRKDKSNMAIVHLTLIFTALFVLFSAATEVNFGTALRHRSILLFPIVFSTVVMYLRRRHKEPLG